VLGLVDFLLTAPQVPRLPAAAMISGLFFVNQKGEIIISRLYRDDVSVAAANAFRTQVCC